MKYFAKVLEKQPTKPGCWDYLRVGVFEEGERPDVPAKQVGEYRRNYSSLFRTFYPFQQNGKWYALYSKDYTSTRVMSLPDCTDLGGEERAAHGFCPVEYYVPEVETYEPVVADKLDGEWVEGKLPQTFGFVAGCVWGDDGSWKIQFLDLTRASEGIIKRDARFGYIEQPRTCETLKDCIEVDYYGYPTPHMFFHIAHEATYRVASGDLIDFTPEHKNYEKKADLPTGKWEIVP